MSDKPAIVCFDIHGSTNILSVVLYIPDPTSQGSQSGMAEGRMGRFSYYSHEVAKGGSCVSGLMMR